MSRRSGGFRARRPFPPATQPLLADVLRRVSASPPYDAGRVHDVFLCDTPALYGALTLWAYRSGGLTQTLANGHVFIRPYDIQRGTVFGRSGEVKNGRPPAYFIAHEMIQDTPEMNPSQSGLYRRYELLVTYLMERRGMSVDELLARPLDRQVIEAQVRAD